MLSVAPPLSQPNRFNHAPRFGGRNRYRFGVLFQPHPAAWWYLFLAKDAYNLFGQQLRYSVAQRAYALYWDGSPSPLLVDRLLLS
jgi:hypothetical protein